MTRSALVLCLAVACRGTPDAAPPPPAPPPVARPTPPKPALPATEDAAMAAYNAKDYATCAEAFAQV
ncbi:MAG TPA: hypothetical protein VGO00_08990, partial [Kofleriaceae bacterium]|nr:hypothetical protein [Kofleriaceae bacterium]